MKYIAKLILLTFLVSTAGIIKAFSQWDEAGLNVSFPLPEIALIDIEPSVNNSITFAIQPSGESGNSPKVSLTSNQNLWLNYSSCLKKNQHSRTIVAELSKNTKKTGITFFVEASNYSGNGQGKVGIPTGRVELSNQPVALISGLGNAFTGDGVNNGHSLSFSVEISDYTKISSSDESVFTIIYTLTDN